MKWYGEMLWRAEVPSAASYEVCATDRRGNKGCATSMAGADDAGVGGADAGTVEPPGGGGGGCCEASGDPRGAAMLIAIVALVLLRRPRARSS